MASMKGVIIAAGYGTRFLPVTKTIPKEMLPLVTKPAIAFVMDEFAASSHRAARRPSRTTSTAKSNSSPSSQARGRPRRRLPSAPPPSA
jgi:CTP:molybdopterin cytidylyltransferase MocA